MAQRAEREPSMEEIVVALRETRRSADRLLPFPAIGTPRGSRALRTVTSPTDLQDLRDGEVDRLLSENARLNARVIALLKVIEQEQAFHAEVANQAEPAETDRADVYREVRSALEAELRPALLVLLRMLQKQFAEAASNGQSAGRKMAFPTGTAPTPSDWIVDLMHKLDDKAPPPTEAIAAAEPVPRRPKLRQCVADVLNAFRFEPLAPTPRQRFPSSEERT